MLELKQVTFEQIFALNDIHLKSLMIPAFWLVPNSSGYRINYTVLSLLWHCFKQPITKSKKLKQPIDFNTFSYKNQPFQNGYNWLVIELRFVHFWSRKSYLWLQIDAYDFRPNFTPLSWIVNFNWLSF